MVKWMQVSSYVQTAIQENFQLKQKTTLSILIKLGYVHITIFVLAVKASDNKAGYMCSLLRCYALRPEDYIDFCSCCLIVAVY